MQRTIRFAGPRRGCQSHPHVDLALLRVRDDDPDVAILIEQGMQAWHDGCRSIARRLADEGRPAEPWSVDTAADLIWSFVFPETLERLTVSCGWPTERYGDLLAVVLRRTLMSTGHTCQSRSTTSPAGTAAAAEATWGLRTARRSGRE